MKMYKGICQMTYNGKGGYLTGIETNRNTDQKRQYELLVLDVIFLAEGKDAVNQEIRSMSVLDTTPYFIVFRNLTVTLHFPADNLPWHEEFALKIEKVKETSSFCQTLEVYLYQMICRLEGKRIVIFMDLMY